MIQVADATITTLIVMKLENKLHTVPNWAPEPEADAFCVFKPFCSRHLYYCY